MPSYSGHCLEPDLVLSPRTVMSCQCHAYVVHWIDQWENSKKEVKKLIIRCFQVTKGYRRYSYRMKNISHVALTDSTDRIDIDVCIASFKLHFPKQNSPLGLQGIVSSVYPAYIVSVLSTHTTRVGRCLPLLRWHEYPGKWKRSHIVG